MRQCLPQAGIRTGRTAADHDRHWVAATLWIPPLIYFGLHRITQRPDVLQFTGAWWSLVFPLGMYSVATEAMARRGEYAVAAYDFAGFLLGCLRGLADCRGRRADAVAPRARPATRAISEP